MLSLQAFRELLSATGSSHSHCPLAQAGNSPLKGFLESRVLTFAGSQDVHCKGKTKVLTKGELKHE